MYLDSAQSSVFIAFHVTRSITFAGDTCPYSLVALLSCLELPHRWQSVCFQETVSPLNSTQKMHDCRWSSPRTSWYSAMSGMSHLYLAVQELCFCCRNSLNVYVCSQPMGDIWSSVQCSLLLSRNWIEHLYIFLQQLWNLCTEMRKLHFTDCRISNNDFLFAAPITVQGSAFGGQQRTLKCGIISKVMNILC
jgi:hypothetical protein